MLDFGASGRRRDRDYSALRQAPGFSAAETAPAQPRTFQGNVRKIAKMLLEATAVSMDPLSAFERSGKNVNRPEAANLHGKSPANGPLAKSLLSQSNINLTNITLSADTKQDFADRYAGFDFGAPNKVGAIFDMDPLSKAEQIFRSDKIVGDLAIGQALNTGGLSASIAQQLLAQQGVQHQIMAQPANGPSFSGPKTKVRPDSEGSRIIVGHIAQLLLASTGLTSYAIALGLAYGAYTSMRPSPTSAGPNVVAQAPAPTWERKRSQQRHYRH